MAYFVTGATGFIGSNLIPLLLERTANKRGAAGHIHLLVRESSMPRMQQRIESWTKGDPAMGKRLKPLLGVAPEAIAKLNERPITHFFHLAAIYDMTAGDELNQLANISIFASGRRSQTSNVGRSSPATVNWGTIEDSSRWFSNNSMIRRF